MTALVSALPIYGLSRQGHSPAMSGFRQGKVLAHRFELVRALGSGGLAEVWVARDLQTGGEVAIKALHEHLVADEGLAERFRRELAVTRTLSHPGIVRVFDLYEHRDEGARARPFFAMELLEGRTLADALGEGPLSPDEARRIARETALALDAAHRQGIVHRDLKPQNIWLCGDGAVKLLDFGLARAAGWSRLTAQSTLMGTPGYLAPELLSGATVDARVDLYALGAVLFEMLTGKRAFPSADPYTALRRKGEAPPSPRAIDLHVSEADDRLVRRALDPDPELRFLDARQMVRELAGERAPDAQPVQVALGAGDFDVVVLHSMRREGKLIQRVCQRLGLAAPGLGFRARLWMSGRNVLVSGASKESAEQVAAALRDEGLAATIEPSKPIGKMRRWIGPRALTLVTSAWAAGWIAATAAVIVGLSRPIPGGPPLLIEPWVDQLWNAISTVAAFAGAFGLGTGFLVLSPLLLLIATQELPSAMATPPALKTKGRVRRFLERHRWRVAAGLAAAGGAIGPLARVLETQRIVNRFVGVPDAARDAWRHRAAIPTWDLALPLALSIFIFAALALAPRRAAPAKLGKGDKGVRRLARGIAARVERLRGVVGTARPASQVVLRDLVSAADGVQATADALAEKPADESAGRDRAVDELLRMAAALDQALAATGRDASAEAALVERLKLEFAGAEAPADTIHSPAHIAGRAAATTV